jgi:uncharacterized protein (TIGR02246 family)
MPERSPAASGSDTPADLAQRFAEAFNRGDAAAIAGLFVDKPDFVNVVGLWWHSREAIERAHAYGFEHIFPTARLSIEKVAVREVGADAAVVHMRWRLDDQSPPAGGDSAQAEAQAPALDARRGILVLVAQRTENGWLAVAAQNTDIVPGAETIVAEGSRRSARSYRINTPD